MKHNMAVVRGITDYVYCIRCFYNQDTCDRAKDCGGATSAHFNASTVCGGCGMPDNLHLEACPGNAEVALQIFGEWRDEDTAETERRRAVQHLKLKGKR
jgi:hypothetical protein